MNSSPYFRYYAAFALILMLVLLLRVQVRPEKGIAPVGQDKGPASYTTAGVRTSL